MTRQYATFDCGMWDDPEGFVTLSAGAQRTYFMLVTQRDIAACGTLPLTLRRWASTCSGGDLDAWLRELAERRYVLIDEATEELFVRTFMKWDAGYKHSKRVQAVIASAKAIRSLSIRNTAYAELTRLGVSVPNPDPSESLRSVVTEVSTDHTPETSLRGGSQEPFDASDEPLSMFCKQHPTGTEEPCGPARGTAIRRYKAAAAVKLEAEVSAKRAAAEARANCGACNEHGFKLDPKTRQPARRCNHEIEAAS